MIKKKKKDIPVSTSMILEIKPGIAHPGHYTLQTLLTLYKHEHLHYCVAVGLLN